jgi:hypothetical protein
MNKKSLLRLFRELRAAQVESLIVYFDIDVEPIAKMVAQVTTAPDLSEAQSVPAPQEVGFIRVVLDEHVSYEHAKKLKDYLITQFEKIDRVVLTMKAQDRGEHVYPEIKIYTQRKQTLDAYKKYPSLICSLHGSKTT